MPPGTLRLARIRFGRQAPPGDSRLPDVSPISTNLALLVLVFGS